MLLLKPNLPFTTYLGVGGVRMLGNKVIVIVATYHGLS